MSVQYITGSISTSAINRQEQECQNLIKYQIEKGYHYEYPWTRIA